MYNITQGNEITASRQHIGEKHSKTSLMNKIGTDRRNNITHNLKWNLKIKNKKNISLKFSYFIYIIIFTTQYMKLDEYTFFFFF